MISEQSLFYNNIIISNNKIDPLTPTNWLINDCVNNHTVNWILFFLSKIHFLLEPLSWLPIKLISSIDLLINGWKQSL